MTPDAISLWLDLVQQSGLPASWPLDLLQSTPLDADPAWLCKLWPWLC